MRLPTPSLRLSALLVALGSFAVHAQQPAAPPSAQGPVFRAEISAVTTDVIARDKNGRFVSTLTKDDFTVLEDGVPQTITSFSLVYGGRTFNPLAPAELQKTLPEGIVLLPFSRTTASGWAARTASTDPSWEPLSTTTSSRVACSVVAFRDAMQSRR